LEEPSHRQGYPIPFTKTTGGRSGPRGIHESKKIESILKLALCKGKDRSPVTKGLTLKKKPIRDGYHVKS